MRGLGSCRLLGSVLLLALLALPASARPAGDEACLACHGMEAFSTPAGRSLFIDAETFAASVHGSFPCSACHTDVASIPHPEAVARVAPEGCARCHAGVVAAYRRGIHGQAHSQGVSEAATCDDCHGSPHGMRKVSDRTSPAYHLNLPRTCGACHGDRGLAKRYGIPVENAYQLYMDSVHGRAVTKSGLLVAANCSSCHGSHEIKPRDDPDSSVNRANVPSTCGACHAGILEDYLTSVHGRMVEAGSPAAPVCVDCHTAHHILRVERVSWQLRIVKECGTCHEESLTTYRDTFHGQVTALGFARVARCSDCHGSHRILPASDPGSWVATRNLVSTCRKCHAGASESFVRFSPHADPRDRSRSPGLYYSALFMEVLIVGVFAFFGLHTVLWLVRSLFEESRPGRVPG